MDVAYKQHSSHVRRMNRSTTNLTHLSLAPLTSKLPLTDPEDLPELAFSNVQYNVSYLQGKSAPTTPRLLSSHSPAGARSRSRRSSMTGIQPSLPKSHSATHLEVATDAKTHGIAPLSPSQRRRKDDHAVVGAKDRSDSDWMLRAGALISTETREYKGQAWLVSKASSTSLAGMRDPDEELFERELAREKELASRRGSRRGSTAGGEDVIASPNLRLGSRSQSKAGGRTLVKTPSERHSDGGYFNQDFAHEEYVQGPDFVSLDEKLEAIDMDTTQDDEAAVRRLVKLENAGTGTWMGNILGWKLFSVAEHNEDSDTATADGEMSDVDEDDGYPLSRSASARQLGSLAIAPETIPPPKADEGGWQDAAWLLSVASRILL